MFWLGKIVAALVLPPNGPFLVAFAGLWLSRRWPRFGRAVAATGLVVLLILSVPFVGSLLATVVNDAPALPPGARVEADAVAILGCGTRQGAPEYGGDALSSLSLDRVRYGAILAKRYGLPVAVAGGSPYGGRSEGDLMREALEQEFGVKVAWVETRSRNTHENATGLRDLLQGQGVRRLLVVVHGVDTRRARREFVAAGFAVTMAPTYAQGWRVSTVWDVVPSIAGLRASYFALYEMLGLLKLELLGPGGT